MIKNKVFKVFLLGCVIFLVFLPFYLLKDYFILFDKFLNPNYSNLKSNNGLTSILLLGKGGEGHTAPDLTDTIINVFLSPKSRKVTLLSLPRDIWIPEIRAKINSAYYWDKQMGNLNYEFTKSSLKSVTDYSPSYVVVVDFRIFEDLINSLGGIKVEVENSFVDNKFPIPGLENDLCDGDRTYACRYETISFEKGTQLMDGSTALKFVRSRNSKSDEGTDFAREARQQKVIEAIKNKVLSVDILLNPKSVSQIVGSVMSNIETNIDFDSAVILSRLFFDSRENIQNISIPQDFLIVSQNSKKYDYQYVFLPTAGRWIDFFTTLPNQIY